MAGIHERASGLLAEICANGRIDTRTLLQGDATREDPYKYLLGSKFASLTTNMTPTFISPTAKGKAINDCIRIENGELVLYNKRPPGGNRMLDGMFHGLRAETNSTVADMSKIAQGIFSVPPELSATLTTLDGLKNRNPFIVDIDMLPRIIAMSCKHELARLRAQRAQLELHFRTADVISEIKDDIESAGKILLWPEISDVRSAKIPTLADFVNIGALQQFFGWDLAPDPKNRLADEKFSILLSPQTFATDYRWVMRQAGLRGRDFAVAYVDIDDFKNFNHDHTETLIDRIFLPVFMRAVESYCFGRAYAYREGGDEYIVLLCNGDKKEAKVFFESMQSFLATVTYGDKISGQPTVSIGIHVVTGDSAVSDVEARTLANCAKAWAKHEGETSSPPQKGRIIFSTPDSLERILTGRDLVLPPKKRR